MNVREGYKQTEFGVIPEEWEEISIGEILNVQTGKKNAQDAVENGEYPFFTRSVETQRIDSFSYDTEALFIAGEGNFAVKYYQGKFDLHQRTYMLTALSDHNVNMKFLQSAITPRIHKLVSTSVGSTVQSLRKPIIEALKVPLPPLLEQQKIAEILSTVDQKIDSIDSKIAKTQTLKRGLMQRLLSEGIGHSEFKESEIGRIPKGWEVTSLEKLSDFITKGATPTTYGFQWEDSGIPFLRSECVSDNGLNLKAAMFISEEANIHMKRSEIQAGDLLMTITGNVGRIVLLQAPFIAGNINQHIARIRLIADNVNTNFIYHYLSQDKYRMNYYKITTGQAYPQISLKQVRESLVPLPPLAEQIQIAEILSTTDEKLESLRAKKEAFETLKKGLMQKLLSGEVRV